MTYAGARGETESQMAGALRFGLGQTALHPAFNALALKLDARGQGAKGSDSKPFRLNIVNAIWGQKDYSFLDEFLDVLAVNYGAGMHLMDFLSEPETSRQQINQWVEDETEERIKDLLPVGSITPETALVLTNAIYFNASWNDPFDPSQTADGAFTTLSGSEVTVPMMHHNFIGTAVEGEDYRAVALPYDGQELSMVVVHPDREAFDQVSASITGDWIGEVLDSLETHQIDLSMPKWKFESDFSLTDTLANMGMPIAMSGQADFSGINGTGGLLITDIFHKAFVAVNESGTEAAAATAVVVGETSAPEPITVALDSPFVFFIYDHDTQEVLFVGRVADPS